MEQNTYMENSREIDEDGNLIEWQETEYLCCGFIVKDHWWFIKKLQELEERNEGLFKKLKYFHSFL